MSGANFLEEYILTFLKWNSNSDCTGRYYNLKNYNISKSWQNSYILQNKKMNLPTLAISITALRDTLTQSYQKNVVTELQHIRLNNSGKLVFYKIIMKFKII